ncbi:MAG: 16S rRNA (adenine(1518)-N(6)/adenine(1519)-N(6))-dimethyltransferase RsmA, partial [Magnetospiraceae bacterium]
IGPGPGGLTRALLEQGVGKLYVVERDERCLAALAEVSAAYPEKMEITAGDALKTDIAQLGAAPRHIVANLPYNISTTLLIQWLRQSDAFAGMTLMFQREVAERIAAAPNSKAYGRLSVMAQWCCDTRILFHIDKKAFTPPPKIMSTVIQLIPRPMPPDAPPFDLVEKIVAAAFGQRRKMLRASLKSLGMDTNALLERAGIAGDLRAESLTVGQFLALADAARYLSPRM